MELFNKAGAIVSSVLVMVGMLIACQAKEDAAPPEPVVQDVAQRLGVHGGAAAERRLREWSDQGSPVASRELAVLYWNDLSRRAEAIRLFEKAARAGDLESTYRLAEMYRANTTAANGANWPMYVQASTQRHAK